MYVLRVVLRINVWFQLPSSTPLFLKDCRRSITYSALVLRAKAGGMVIEEIRDEEEGDVFYVTTVMMIIGIPSNKFSLLFSSLLFSSLLISK
jgi:hypothetical protein